MFDHEARQHGLVHGAHRNGGGEETRRMLGRPPCRHASRPVLPKELPPRQTLPGGLSRRQRPWNSKDRLGSVVSEHPLHPLVDPAVELPRRRSGGNGEIEPFDSARGEELGKTPERRFGFARTRFSLEDHQQFIAPDGAHNGLRGFRLGVTGQLDKRQGRTAREPRDIEPKLRDGAACSVPRHLVVVLIEGPDELEEPLVRSDPVGQCHETREKVREPRMLGQSLAVPEGIPEPAP